MGSLRGLAPHQYVQLRPSYFQTEINMLAPPRMGVSPCSQTLPHDHEGRAE